MAGTRVHREHHLHLPQPPVSLRADLDDALRLVRAVTAGHRELKKQMTELQRLVSRALGEQERNHTMEDHEIARRHTYSPPDADRVKVHESINNKMLEVAHWLNEMLPEGRNKSLALTHLEDVQMRANKAVATDS